MRTKIRPNGQDQGVWRNFADLPRKKADQAPGRDLKRRVFTLPTGINIFFGFVLFSGLKAFSQQLKGIPMSYHGSPGAKTSSHNKSSKPGQYAKAIRKKKAKSGARGSAAIGGGTASMGGAGGGG